jgi:hypothetical protein
MERGIFVPCEDSDSHDNLSATFYDRRELSGNRGFLCRFRYETLFEPQESGVVPCEVRLL